MSAGFLLGRGSSSGSGIPEGISVSTGLSLSGTTLTAPLSSSADYWIHSLGVGTAASGTAGEIRATNNITAYYSDARLKENIVPIDSAIQKVMAISGVHYNSNALAETFGYTDKSKQVGVLAQEIQQVLPEAVALAPFDSVDGVTSHTGESYLTVRYERIVPLLIEAIKDLQKQIDELKGK